MGMVTLTIDGRSISVPEGTTILDAAGRAGIQVPTLCFFEGLNNPGACRVCVVEVKGGRNLLASCVAPVAKDMVVWTNSPAVRSSRRTTLELILSDHPYECLTCVRNLSCELQKLAETMGIREVRFEGEKSRHQPDRSSPSIVRENEKCVLCRRCVAACEKLQGLKVIAPLERGFGTIIAPPFGADLMHADCTFCGQCVLACPTGALHEQDDTDRVWAAISDPKKHVIVQTAPATRVAVGETVGMAPGSLVTGQMVAALRRLGFDRVFDTDFSADLTIVEEGHELLHRLGGGGPLPLITSCSPGWIKFIEHQYPALLEHLSTCKSPQQMFGAMAKTYYAAKAGIDPADIYVVSIMPCTAKKFEAARPEMNSSGHPDVDAVLTTRELGRMIREAGIDFAGLPEEQFDAPLGIATGAGVIFGVTGGVMEAALRTVYEKVTGQTLRDVNLTTVRGMEGIRQASIDLGPGKAVKVAVAHTLGNARRVLELIAKGEADWQFVEIMSCPGGCLGGGGQPIPTTDQIRAARAAGIYSADERSAIRKSHENPAVQALYREFLGEPLGPKSHQLLHTHYLPRGKYRDI